MICIFVVCSRDIEQTIKFSNNQINLKNPQVGAHRQAWAWQDEWFGLTMEDIREFERETQLLLQRKMGLESGDDDEDGKLKKCVVASWSVITSILYIFL